MAEIFENSRNRKTCILLTATIDPKGVVLTKRNDPLVREQDHIDALTRWGQLPFPVVFCENSGYELGKIRSMVGKQTKADIEILQFDGQNFPKELGKGYGELNTIKYAITHSQLINNSDYVIKVSGRYFIKNIEKIAKALLLHQDTYVMVDLQKNLGFADSRVFGFKPSFISDYLSKRQDLLNDSKGVFFEHVLAQSVLRAVSDGRKWLPLPSKPIIIGYSGTSDTPCGGSKMGVIALEVIQRVKNYLNRKY